MLGPGNSLPRLPPAVPFAVAQDKWPIFHITAIPNDFYHLVPKLFCLRAVALWWDFVLVFSGRLRHALFLSFLYELAAIEALQFGIAADRLQHRFSPEKA